MQGRILFCNGSVAWEPACDSAVNGIEETNPFVNLYFSFTLRISMALPQ